MMAVEGKRGSVQGGPDPGGSAGRAGIVWIRTKESLKTNGKATWVSSVLPLGRGKEDRPDCRPDLPRWESEYAQGWVGRRVDVRVKNVTGGSHPGAQARRMG